MFTIKSASARLRGPGCPDTKLFRCGVGGPGACSRGFFHEPESGTSAFSALHLGFAFQGIGCCSVQWLLPGRPQPELREGSG